MNLKTKTLLPLLFVVNYIASGQHNQNISKNNQKGLFEKEQLENQVLTQYYRWFQVFEREINDARIKNHMQILDDSVLIATTNGPLKGKEGMLGFLNFVSTWKNSHHIENVTIEPNTDGSITLEADITYQNILPDGKQNEFKLHYTTNLKEVNNELPLFTQIKLLHTETISEPDFIDAYPENRSKSFLHYWFHLLDSQEGDEARFKELLATDFRLNPDNKEITNYKDFEDWVQRTQVRYKTSFHSIKNFRIISDTDETIKVSAEVDWKAIKNNGEKVRGEFRTEWMFQNDLNERFARVKEMKLYQTKPLQLVKEF